RRLRTSLPQGAKNRGRLFCRADARRKTAEGCWISVARASRPGLFAALIMEGHGQDARATKMFDPTARYLIFNADDFGASHGINRGIIDCHTKGVLTSTSLMVTGRGLDEAIELSKSNPNLAIGLHWDVWGEDEREFDTQNL